MLHVFISRLVTHTVTSIAALRFLYLVFTLRHFIMLNTILNEVVLSTVKEKCILPLKFRRVSDFLSERYSVKSCVRYILYRHVMLCDIMELINSSYSLQVLSLIRSKFLYATISLYLLFISIFDRSLFLVRSFTSQIPLGTFEEMQLVTALYCCESTCLQVSII